MTESYLRVPGLTIEGCRRRQARLRDHLAQAGLDAALICDRRHVHYFTGYWCRELFRPVVLVERDGSTNLAIPIEAQIELAADDIRIYPSNQFGTLADDQLGEAIRSLGSRLRPSHRIGADAAWPRLPGSAEAATDITPALLGLRRCKDTDEIAMLRFAAQATEAAYTAARGALREGVDEVELWVLMQAAAARFVGETLGEFGNDFQIGAIGSPPRRRAAETGEVAILDLSVVVRGYAGDLCRSLIVGAEPTDEQRLAFMRLNEMLDESQAMIEPGIPCRAMDARVREVLDGYRGWSFGHHLGHGIGLCNHEAPRLNPRSDDQFAIGDVFTLEPGLYGPDLRAGLRIEHMYHLTADGLEQLDPPESTHSRVDEAD